jgi:hypothetical protein
MPDDAPVTSATGRSFVIMDSRTLSKPIGFLYGKPIGFKVQAREGAVLAASQRSSSSRARDG